MKRTISLLLISATLAFGQAPAKPKHPKLNKIKTAFVKTAEATGVVILLGLVIVAAGGTNVKVYSN
jgi:hypothetical protein